MARLRRQGSQRRYTDIEDRGFEMRRWNIVLLACTLVASGANAHEAGMHLKGIVKEVTSTRILLGTSDGTAIAVDVSSRTRVLRGSTVVGLDAVKPGERAVVHVEEEGSSRRATMIKLGESPPR